MVKIITLFFLLKKPFFNYMLNKIVQKDYYSIPLSRNKLSLTFFYLVTNMNFTKEAKYFTKYFN